MKQRYMSIVNYTSIVEPSIRELEEKEIVNNGVGVSYSDPLFYILFADSLLSF